MVQVFKKPVERLTEDHIGKICFQDGPFIFPTYVKPRLITSLAHSRVFLASLKTIWKDDEKVHIIYNEKKEDEGYILAKSIRLVCDNVGEANEIIRRNRMVEVDFNNFLNNQVASWEIFLNGAW
jgi:hypothetical protein